MRRARGMFIDRRKRSRLMNYDPLPLKCHKRCNLIDKCEYAIWGFLFSTALLLSIAPMVELNHISGSYSKWSILETKSERMRSPRPDLPIQCAWWMSLISYILHPFSCFDRSAHLIVQLAVEISKLKSAFKGDCKK